MSAKPLLIGLVGTRLTGRDTIARHLKHVHGFACAAFDQPAVSAMYTLYGLSPLDVLDGGKDRALSDLGGYTARELSEGLCQQARATAGRHYLIDRLERRAIARGDWRQKDLVITDVRQPEEIAWLRRAGGLVWWIHRGEAPTTFEELLSVQSLMRWNFDHRDCVLINKGSLDELRAATEQMLFRTRTVLEEQPRLELLPSAVHN